jgi:mono/diheme cytochrome c family protein
MRSVVYRLLSSILHPPSSILHPPSSKKLALAFFALCALILVASCGPNMRDQARCEHGDVSTFFPDGKCAQVPPPNTVARGVGQEDQGLTTTSAGGSTTGDIPFPVTREVLEEGRQRYDIYCAPCHGLSGYGNGMIVRRGFPAPPSLHDQRLRDAPPGYIYDVITNGFGRMYSYAYRVEPEQRWAIAAYIRALQLSQNATVDDIPPEERQRLGAAQ